MRAIFWKQKQLKGGTWKTRSSKLWRDLEVNHHWILGLVNFRNGGVELESSYQTAWWLVALWNIHKNETYLLCLVFKRSTSTVFEDLKLLEYGDMYIGIDLPTFSAFSDIKGGGSRVPWNVGNCQYIRCRARKLSLSSTPHWEQVSHSIILVAVSGCKVPTELPRL